MIADDFDALAAIWHAASYRSRRWAKRMLRDAGGDGTAPELDRVLSHIAQHPRHMEILRRVEEIEAARADAERAMTSPRPGNLELGGDEALWVIGDDTGDLRPGSPQVMVYIGCDAAFTARIFDDRADAPEGEGYAIDHGGWLGDIAWLGERPDPGQVSTLMEEARRRVRMYDEYLGV